MEIDPIIIIVKNPRARKVFCFFDLKFSLNMTKIIQRNTREDISNMFEMVMYFGADACSIPKESLPTPVINAAKTVKRLN